MTVGLGQDMRKAVLDHVLGGTALAQPTTFRIKAHTGDPGTDGTSNEVPATNGYAELTGVAVTIFDAAIDESATVAAAIVNAEQTFPTPTGQWASGATIDHFSFWNQDGTVFIGKAEFAGTTIDSDQDRLKVGVGTKFQLAETV